jgi:outer membrane protein TolC
MKARASLALLTSVWIAAAANGAADGTLTLHECISWGLARNPKLESEKFTLAADKENIWKERASFLPDLKANARMDVLNGSPVSPFAVLGVNDLTETGVITARSQVRSPVRVSWAGVGTGELGLVYPLYANGSILGLNTPPGVAAAKAVYNKQDSTIRLAEQDVIARVVGVFFNTTAYEQKVELDQQKVELSKKRLQIVQEELTLNLILPQDVELAKAELAANQQLLVTSQQRATDSERILAELLGRPPRQKLRLDQSEPRIPALPPLDGFLSRVTAAHPAVAVQRANIDVAQQHYRLTQTALYPSVGFEATFTGATAFGSQNVDLFFAGVSVQVPIFDFGGKLAAEHEALNLVKAAQAELDEVQLELRESILDQLSQIHTTESNLANLEHNYVQAANSLALIQSQREQGIAAELALVDVELGLVEVKDQLILTRLVQRLEYAQLQRLAGGVWVWNR